MFTATLGTARARATPAPTLGAALLAAIVAGCSTLPPQDDPAPGQPPAQQPADPGEQRLPPPWTEPRLSPATVPGELLTAWRAAENRGRCALIAPADPGAQGTPRIATFSGGWGVAWDQPGLRSAFGVAGTGASAEGPSYEWPFVIHWSDGSSAGYGPEGGTGPNQLAYVRVAGQHCLYNVWSRISRSHLQHLLQSLRFVDTGS